MRGKVSDSNGLIELKEVSRALLKPAVDDGDALVLTIPVEASDEQFELCNAVASRDEG